MTFRIKKIILLLFLFLVFSSFFWEDEEKELRNLHQTAEAAMKCGDFNCAKEAYQTILKKITVTGAQKYRVDWQTYFDISLRLAEAHESLEEREEGEKVLIDFIFHNPPEKFIPHVKLLQARLIAGQNSPEKAFKMMQSVAQTHPVKKWRSEELSFFHALGFALDEHYDEMLHKAKRFFVTAYYEQAILIYEEILQAITDKNYPKANQPNSLIQKKVRLRLAECHYYQANIDKALAYVDENPNISDRIDCEMLYLSALCFKEKKEYEQALKNFQLYANSADQANLEHYNHALFEIGLHFYKAKNFSMAKSFFENLQRKHEKKGKAVIVGATYLARIYLEENKPSLVEPLLSPLFYSLSQDELLKHELFYLRGLAAFQLENFSAARDFFERSLAPNFRGQWTLQARFQLALSYLKLGDDLSKGKEVRKGFFEKAESIFKRLVHTGESQSASLALARLYLLYDQHFNKCEKRRLVSEVLSTNQNMFTKDGSLEALLLCAEAEENYAAREKLYEIATGLNFQSCNAYCNAWYARGINHFKQGMQGNDDCFELAVAAFEKAFYLLERKDEKKALQILKLEAKANYYRHSPISSLALLEKLLNHFDSSHEREEILYLRGVIASQLTDLYYFPVAEESFLRIMELHPKGLYADRALLMLGTLYYRQENYLKAKEMFLELSSKHPQSAYAGEAWFWAAESAEKLQERDPEIKYYRHCAYTHYPENSYAPEAYFRVYSYMDYYNGNAEALSHLKEFPLLFPSTPFLTVSSYLLGKGSTLFEEAKDWFEEAIHVFQSTLEEGKIPEVPFIYFRYQSMLELALLHLEFNSDLEKAVGYLSSIIRDFSDNTHPLTLPLKQKSLYPTIFEESEFALARCFIQMKKIHLAQEIFSSMLTHYSESGVETGVYLSQIWCEQGKLAMENHDLDTAINCFKIAEECGECHLSDDQRLSLWILESECYVQNEQLDNAMRMLSKAINETVTSPLRLKAMYLRAEIYEMQGRPELAMRQLEAMSKKGGEWAMEAQEKLRSQYGLE